MKTIFDDNLVFSFQKVVERSLKEFFDEKGLVAFQKALKDGMNGICAEIQQRLIEAIDNELVDNCSLRKDWVVERRSDTKTIQSPFGQVTYQRTYFKNRKTKKYGHLADLIVGYTPHQRLDTLLEADLLEQAIDRSYRKAGLSQEKHVPGTGVSGQTVLNIVRKFHPEQIEVRKKSKMKKGCRILYIEADEDHVSHCEKGVHGFEQRLVYVHEGRVPVGKDRYELVGYRYFTFGPGTKSEEMWDTVWRHLDDNYDLEKTERIFISGDGAHWIKKGVEYIPDSSYVMDGFHLRKAIFKAAGADTDKREALALAIWNGKWSDMNRLLISFREEAQEDSRKQAILEVQGYLNNNWSGIQARRKYRGQLVGCSAEGHVSHILSERLSSRPMGWSCLGANQVAHLRVHRANGIDVHQIHIEQSTKEQKQFILEYLPNQTAKSLAKAVGSNLETLGNIPTLQGGSRSFAPLLRKIANTTFDF